MPAILAFGTADFGVLDIAFRVLFWIRLLLLGPIDFGLCALDDGNGDRQPGRGHLDE